MLTILLMAIKKRKRCLYTVRGCMTDSGALLNKGAIFLYIWNHKSLALKFNKS